MTSESTVPNGAPEPLGQSESGSREDVVSSEVSANAPTPPNGTSSVKAGDNPNRASLTIDLQASDHIHRPSGTSTPPRSATGWDGKLRVEKKPVLANPEALSDPEYSDEENVFEGEVIGPDEDLLDDYDAETEEIDLVHCKIASIPALHLERFKCVRRLCLRQNQITVPEFPSTLWPTLQELELYDNLISHIKGLEELAELTSLDLSFNKIRHIKRVNHLRKLKDLYFVQNKISKVENLEGLTELRNLELAANRIREIEGLDTLRALEQLWLGKNKITEIKNLSNLTNLTILSIQSNRLTSLSGLEELVNLEELYVSHNLLDSIAAPALATNTKLRTLDISANPISKLENLSHLTELEELWASYCKLESFDEVEKELGGLEELETVYLEGNPLQIKAPVLYRNKVRLALPRIKQIDATFVRVQ